jgi:hypothetical protein
MEQRYMWGNETEIDLGKWNSDRYVIIGTDIDVGKWNTDTCGEIEQRYSTCGEMDQRYCGCREMEQR